MKSSMHIKGHPVHPILIAFPTAFFAGAFLFDLLSFFLSYPALWFAATYMEIAGVISGVIAAIPGTMDYFLVVPPGSSAKKRAAKHGVLNLSMVGLFALAFALRVRPPANFVLIISLELLGFILLVIAGFMGGTLVYRNQIGVYNRYASSGKWKEDDLGDNRSRVEAARSDELKTDQMKLLHVNDKRIVLARTETKYVAFDDHCSHKGGSLAGGVMICGTVQCPWHGSQFDVKTGAVKAGPATEGIATYRVEEDNGKVYILL
ncbi:MAG: hypothetical protein BGO69_18025 [Bacteroidetes bacterium 46-16]|nr:MAG: hypothetical protein BGO69_18025 [Bacteroidetes bacterium 46-16]